MLSVLWATRVKDADTSSKFLPSDLRFAWVTGSAGAGMRKSIKALPGASASASPSDDPLCGLQIHDTNH